MTPQDRASMDRDLAEMRIQLAERKQRKNQRIANGEGRHGRSRSDQGHRIGRSVGRADGRPLPTLESSPTISEGGSSEVRSSRVLPLPSPPAMPPSQTPMNMMLHQPPPPPSSTGFNGPPHLPPGFPPLGNFPIPPPGILPPASFEEWLAAGGPNLPLHPPGLPHFPPGIGVPPGDKPPPSLSMNPNGIPFAPVAPPKQPHPRSAHVTETGALPTGSEPTMTEESNQEDMTEDATLNPESEAEADKMVQLPPQNEIAISTPKLAPPTASATQLNTGSTASSSSPANSSPPSGKKIRRRSRSPLSKIRRLFSTSS